MNRTLLNPAKREALARTLVDLPPGDLAELGVYRGGVARMLATAYPDRPVHLFDTFAGIPQDGWNEADGHKPGDFATSLEDVRQYLADCPNVVFHPGLFPGTATGERFALVHLDADLYVSTLAGLEWFWPRLARGGSLVLDDWHWHMCRGVDKAVRDYFGEIHSAAKFTELAEHQLIITRVA